MKKIYLSLLVAGFAANGAIGQNLTAPHSFGELNQPSHLVVKEKQTLKPIHYSTKAVLWSEDFGMTGVTGPASTPGPTFTTANGDWTTGGADGNIWKHSFSTTSGEWSTNASAFTSTTAANGFMLFDVDSINLPISPSYINATGELISPAIDLTAASSAKLTMQQDFRWCCSGTHSISVSVSSDMGATWGTPYDLIPASLSTNSTFVSTTGSYDISANISGDAAGNTVMLKFTWDGVGAGSSHYFWQIDDIEIVDLPDHDIQMTSAYISGENNGGIEYGRTPSDQVDGNYFVGSGVYNGGANDAINTTLTADFGSFVSTPTLALIAPDSTEVVEAAEALTLTTGVYTGTYTVVSDDETAGTEFYNNTGGREFEVTGPSAPGNPMTVYSQDGIGVYTTDINIGSLGTNSFTGGEDGLVCATLYHMKANADVVGLRVMLATGTVAGAEVYGSIKDTATFWASDMSSLYNCTPGVVTTADIAAGYIDLEFPTPAALTPNAYYAAVELYSNGEVAHIRIADDETVAQPYDASAIYIPGDQSYTNGEALGIRMLMGSAGVNENTLAGVAVYPNPSTGLINVTNINATANTIVVYDMVGKVVMTKAVNASTTLDLTSNGTGIYLIEISNENGSFVERVVIK